MENLLWCIGPPLRASFKDLLDEARADEAVALYRDRFGDVGLFENDLSMEFRQRSMRCRILEFAYSWRPESRTFMPDVSLNVLELLSILSGSSDRK